MSRQLYQHLIKCNYNGLTDRVVAEKRVRKPKKRKYNNKVR